MQARLSRGIYELQKICLRKYVRWKLEFLTTFAVLLAFGKVTVGSIHSFIHLAI